MLSQHLLKIAVGHPVPAVSPHRLGDDVLREVPTGKIPMSPDRGGPSMTLQQHRSRNDALMVETTSATSIADICGSSSAAFARTVMACPDYLSRR